MDELLNTVETPPPPKRNLRWAFVGSNGVRAGWSILVFLLFYVVLSAILAVAVSFLYPPHHVGTSPADPGIVFIGELVQFGAVLFATFLMGINERKKVEAYGYAGTARLTRFLAGLICGFLAISLLIGILWKTHLLVFDSSTLHGGAVWKYGIEWGTAFLLTAFFEESLLRGYLQFTLARGIGFWWGALALSLLFGLVHKGNPGESPVGLFSAAAIGLVFCLSLWYTGSLWWAVGFHAAWDWGQSFFYGTADSGILVNGHFLSSHPAGGLLWSGGTTGPEGSMFIVPMVLLLALLMWLWWRRGAISPFKK